MYTLQVEISDDTYQALQQLAQENATDLSTLLRLQADELAKVYQKGEVDQKAKLTKGLSLHLAASIKQHRQLLQRLAE